ncbi:DUF4118 domain-containing protein [Phenylobacterium aquaticum]|uniref:DUF4118 domain-containing protein n=1 Tax=Phenylobacterium aquaticum TaxID=1763816 RepID=UPI0026F01775|nr:DUF4118 domain-containing protein [Phenylobacterium aquaticum]
MTRQISPPRRHPRDPTLNPAGLKYVSALSLVAAGLVLRFLLTPVFGVAHIYTVFYPIVLMSAYALGARPAILAAGLSAALGYWVFAPPALQWKLTPASLTGVSFFAVTCAIGIILICGLMQALKEVTRRQDQTDLLARHEAERFKVLSARVTDHLERVSGLLTIEAEARRDPTLAATLQRAAEQSLLIARLHRDFAGQPGETAPPPRQGSEAQPSTPLVEPMPIEAPRATLH